MAVLASYTNITTPQAAPDFITALQRDAFTIYADMATPTISGVEDVLVGVYQLANSLGIRIGIRNSAGTVTVRSYLRGDEDFTAAVVTDEPAIQVALAAPARLRISVAVDIANSIFELRVNNEPVALDLINPPLEPFSNYAVDSAQLMRYETAPGTYASPMDVAGVPIDKIVIEDIVGTQLQHDDFVTSGNTPGEASSGPAIPAGFTAVELTSIDSAVIGGLAVGDYLGVNDAQAGRYAPQADGGIALPVDPIDGETYTILVMDESNAYAESYTAITVSVESSDAVSPTITLVGSSSVSVIQNQTYTDAGATANDDVDGDITANIVTVSNVNTATVGTYSVTYNIDDAAGNSAIEVVRTVSVVSTAISGSNTLTVGEGALFSADFTIANAVSPALSGADAAIFSIANTAGDTWQVTGPAQSYLSPADADTNNIYLFNIVDNGQMLAVSLSVTQVGAVDLQPVLDAIAALQADVTVMQAYINTNIDVALSTRAAQAAVDAIPTNPLRDNAALLANIDAPISVVQLAVANIPLNPLLDDAAVLSNIDAPVSAVQNSLSAQSSDVTYLVKRNSNRIAFFDADGAPCTVFKAVTQVLYDDDDSVIETLQNVDANGDPVVASLAVGAIKL